VCEVEKQDRTSQAYGSKVADMVILKPDSTQTLNL